jgi:hypothetical protein
MDMTIIISQHTYQTCQNAQWEIGNKEINEGEGTGECMVERENEREREAGCVSSQGWGR